MEGKGYFEEASLYYAKSAHRKQKALVFRRFEHGAEAIRFAIEDLPKEILQGSTLEINDERFLGEEIRPLYDDNAFPLPRRDK